MLNKRGVDAVVATVLIIMITVAAVAIIWMTIIPMIKTSLTESTAEKVSLSIETAGGYTVWDENNENLKVQIKRGADNSNLTGIQIVFFNGIESRIYVINGSNIPSPNLMTVVGFALGGFGKPETITIYPIVNGKMGEASSKISELKISSKVIEPNEIDYGNVLTLVDETDCSDGIDNNDNGLIDCLDSSCEGIDSCEFELELSCEDSFDNDGDGDVDCSDSDCSSSNNCIVQSLRQGLVGYWPFEETSGTTAVDYSGNGKNGFCTNMGVSCSSTTGKVGNAFSFDGSNDYIDIGISGLPISSSNRTVCLWAKTDVASGYDWTIGYGSTGIRSSFALGTQGTNLDLSAFGNDLVVNNFWTIGTWKFICGEYNGTHAMLYTNGQLNITQIKSFNTGSSAAYIGRQVPVSEYWDGMIDEVTIWNRTLSEAEVSQLYNAGDGMSLIE